MKKLLLLVVIVAGGLSYLRNNAIVDPHTQTAGWSFPTLGVGSASGLAAMITSMLPGPGQIASAGGSPQSETSQNMSSTNVTHIANPAGGGAKGVGSGTTPSDLMRFVNPSLLTTTADGTQSLSPAGQQALQQIVAMARTNPAAFKEQLATGAKPSRGQ